MPDDQRFRALAQSWPLLALAGTALIVLSGHALLVAYTRTAVELVSPTALAAAPDRRLYCFVQFSRVVSLDPDGRVLASWRVATGQGAARLHATQQHLEVAAIRTGKRLVYSFDGELIQTYEDPGAFDRFSETRQVSFPGGEVVAIRGESLVRVKPEPPSVIIAPRPWPLAGMPYSSKGVTLAAIPGALALLLSWAARRAQRELAT